jgi:DNA-binding SARP family transcriptional activator
MGEGVQALGETAPSTNVQLCGGFAVELAGRRVDQAFPGRQGRLLFAYLALSRLEQVPRDVLIDVLWGDSLPAAAGAALNVVVSKLRAAVGPDVLRGRTELSLRLPEPARVDVETAAAALHAAESAVARGDWRRAWSCSLTAQFVGRRRFLPESDAEWAESWRRRLAETHARGLECYATACLEIGGPEIPGAERAARQLLAIAPLRETGQLLLMRALAARGNVAEALAAYERFRNLLRNELGVDPCPALRDTHAALLG